MAILKNYSPFKPYSFEIFITAGILNGLKRFCPLATLTEILCPKTSVKNFVQNRSKRLATCILLNRLLIYSQKRLYVIVDQFKRGVKVEFLLPSNYLYVFLTKQYWLVDCIFLGMKHKLTITLLLVVGFGKTKYHLIHH